MKYKINQNVKGWEEGSEITKRYVVRGDRMEAGVSEKQQRHGEIFLYLENSEGVKFTRRCSGGNTGNR